MNLNLTIKMCRYISWKIADVYEAKTYSNFMNQYKAGVILINDDNKFLLVKNYDGKWTFPKGGVERGENLQEAASRELYEETGISLPASKMKIFYKYYKQTYFICRSVDDHYNEEIIKDKVEITGVGWFCFKHINSFEIGRPTLKILSIIQDSLIS